MTLKSAEAQTARYLGIFHRVEVIIVILPQEKLHRVGSEDNLLGGQSVGSEDNLLGGQSVGSEDNLLERGVQAKLNFNQSGPGRRTTIRMLSAARKSAGRTIPTPEHQRAGSARTSFSHPHRHPPGRSEAYQK